MFGGIKIDAADRVFSQYIRTRAGWSCERCGKHYEPPTSALQCSHFVGRRNENTRFSDENCSALCYGCHGYFTANPNEHREWMLKKLGKKRFDALIVAGHIMKKKDRKLSLIIAKELLKNLE